MNKTIRIIEEMRETFCQSRKDCSENIIMDSLCLWQKNCSLDQAVSYLGVSGLESLRLSMFCQKTVSNIVRTYHKLGKPYTVNFESEKILPDGSIIPESVICCFKNKTVVFYNKVQSRDAECGMEIIENCGLTAVIKNINEFYNVCRYFENIENPLIGFLPPKKHGQAAVEVHLYDISYFLLPSMESISKSDLMHIAKEDAELAVTAESAHLFVKQLGKKTDGNLESMLRQIIDLYQIGIYDNNKNMKKAMQDIMCALTSGSFDIGKHNQKYHYYCPDNICRIFNRMKDDFKPYFLKGRSGEIMHVNINTYDITVA